MINVVGGKRGSLACFAIVLALVVGGLAVVTRVALRVEQERLAQQAAADHNDALRLALWRLDSRVSNILVREDSRPFNHYSAVFAPSLALDPSGAAWHTGSILEPSPLLNAELPSWMLLHFQTDSRGWESPQVLSPLLRNWLTHSSQRPLPINVTPARQKILTELSRNLPATSLLHQAREHTVAAVVHDRVLLAFNNLDLGNYSNSLTNNINYLKNQGVQAAQEFNYRAGNQSKLAATINTKNPEKLDKDLAQFNLCRNGEEWLVQGQRNQILFGATTTKDSLPSSYSYAVPVAPGIEPPVGRPHSGPTVVRDVEESSKTVTGSVAPPPTTPAQAAGVVPSGQPQNLPRASRVPSLALVHPRPGAEVTVSMSPMVSVWLPTRQAADKLVVLRLVHVEKKEVCQGIVLDADPLRQLLAEEVQDLFPDARVLPASGTDQDDLALTMTTLPLRLDPGPLPDREDPGWTTLRVGLCLAWAAAMVALLAVALGGWSLLDLSERRIRFVSAVTHELRTPLTTLRLYLDLLLGGLVRAEMQRQEYLQTMEAETDRLTRLVNNVLDYSRLERHNPQRTLIAHSVDAVLVPVTAAWQARCLHAGKHLEVDNSVAPEVMIRTDAELLAQVLGILLDNACKYSREAEDPLIRLRVRLTGNHVSFEVEDRGPGVPVPERQIIFRPFRRGRAADAATGGVGLGLALAQRWTQLLGGRLSLESPSVGGACFCVEVPALS